jgi:hypothetical protein
MAVTFERGARFEELVFDPGAYGELIGHNCTGEPWATVPCSAGLALGGGELRFEYPGSADELVRMSKRERRKRVALPKFARVVLRGEELQRWWLPDTRMLPGDSIVVHL